MVAGGARKSAPRSMDKALVDTGAAFSSRSSLVKKLGLRGSKSARTVSIAWRTGVCSPVELKLAGRTVSPLSKSLMNCPI